MGLAAMSASLPLADMALDYGLPLQPISPELASYEELVDEFDRVTPLLEPALARNGGTHLPVDVLAAIAGARMQLWTGSHTAAVTEIVEYPRIKTVNVFLAGGRLADCQAWGAPGGPLDQWAASVGAEAVTTEARLGWSRRLPNVEVLGVQLFRRIT